MLNQMEHVLRHAQVASLKLMEDAKSVDQIPKLERLML